MSNSKRQADDVRMSSSSSDDEAVSNDNASKCESDNGAVESQWASESACAMSN